MDAESLPAKGLDIDGCHFAWPSDGAKVAGAQCLGFGSCPLAMRTMGAALPIPAAIIHDRGLQWAGVRRSCAGDLRPCVPMDAESLPAEGLYLEGRVFV